MKHLLSFITLLLTLNLTGQIITPPGTVFADKPLVITKGGKYTGNYRSNDPTVPAVWIWTSEPVEIYGMIVESQGIGIKYEGNGNALIHHNTISGLAPSNNDMYGRGIYSYQPQSFECYNNTISHTGGGIMVDGAGSGGLKKLKILYNKLHNMDKRRTDLTQGYEHRSGIQVTNALIPDADIWYNEITNAQDSSWMEDGISIMNSGGIATRPLVIKNNYLDGSYPYPSRTVTSFTGSGITIECSSGVTQFDKMSQYVNAYSNQVIRAGNAAMNIAAGHHIHYYNNTMISSGKLPDGTASNIFWGATANWNGVGAPVENLIDTWVRGNTVAYVRPGINIPYANRQDWVAVDGAPYNVKAGDNTSLPNPITKATEDAEYPKWLKKLSDSSIVLGNLTGTSNPPITTPPANDTSTITLKFGESMAGKVLVKNILGAVLSSTTGFKDLTITADSLSILQIDQSLGDLTTFTIKGIKPGIASLYVTVTSNGNVRMSKTIKITVTADLNEATSFDVILPYKP